MKNVRVLLPAILPAFFFALSFSLLFVISLVLSFVSAPAIGATDSGAPLLTLDDAVRIALTDNHRVQSAALEVNQVQERVAAIKTRRYPKLELIGGVKEHLSEQTYTFDQGTWDPNSPIGPIPPYDVRITSQEDNTGYVSFGVAQPLSQLYGLSLRIAEGEVIAERARERVRLTQQEMARLVKREYFEIGRINGDLHSIDQSIEFYASLATLVGNYVSQQVALEYELLDVEARLARRKLEGNRRLDELQTARERLNALLARPLHTPFRIQHLPDPQSINFDTAQSIRHALAQRPDVAETALHIKQAELSYDVKKSEYIPDVELRLRYAKLYDVNLIPDNEAYIALHAKWEIFDWGRKRDQLAGKRSAIHQAQQRSAEVYDRVQIEVRNSLRKLHTSQQSVGVAEQAQRAYRDKVRVLLNRYRQQAALLQDLLEAETELERANSEYNRAVLSVWAALADYEKAIGAH